MKKNLLHILLLLLPATSLFAQVNYTFFATTATYSAVTGGTAPVLTSPYEGYLASDEGYANEIPIGFPFLYNGVSYSKINLNVNGFATLGQGFGYDPDETFYVNDLTAGDELHNDIRPILAPLWDDMDLVDEANIKYQLTGTAPNRVFTVEWAKVRWTYQAPAASMSFQLKLYETTNVIEFAYHREAGSTTGASASIGITGTRTGLGNFVSVSSGAVSASVSSTTETKTIDSRPTNNLVFRFTPLACVAPSITNLANVTSNSATFSWNAPAGVPGYEYAVSPSPDPPASGTATSATSVNVVLTPGVNNYLFVRSACGGGSFSNWARRATVLCTGNIAPANGAITTKSPTLEWTKLPGATAYTIMLSIDGVEFFNVGTLDTSATTAGINNLNYLTTYYFYVRPVIGSDTASESCASNATSFTVGPPPTIPCTTNILPANGATNVSPAAAIIKWHSVANADGYEVMLSADGGATYEDLGNIDDTTVNLGGLGIIDYNATYYYYVRPFIDTDTASTSCSSNATSFSTSGVPPAPQNDDCEGAITLSYNTPMNATTLGATEYMEAEVCNGFPGVANDDVWFKFTAVSNGAYTISLTNAAVGLDAVIQAYIGTCGSFSSIGCADATFDAGNETLKLNNLVAGQTYYFRVYGFYDYVDGGTFTIQVSSPPLPITLSNFSGQHVNDKNLLNWTTQTEQNSKGFELQRSADGIQFSSIAYQATKAAGGLSIGQLQYQYTDAKPFAGNCYYRLKHFDRDGSFTYSSVVLLKGSRSSSFMLSALYPNPVASQLGVVLTSPSAENMKLVVTDMSGKVVVQYQARVVAGDNNVKIDVSKLTSGTYLVKAVCNNGCETATQKFVKQ